MLLSASVKSFGDLLKYTLAASSIPKAFSPKYTELRYIIKICSLL